jgi:mannose-6-phosphate isomerase-like protein (cupin superfamily)
MNEYKWITTKYDWGQIGKLKDVYRDGDKIKYTDADYWPIDTFHGIGGININRNLYNLDDTKKDFVLKYWEFREEDTEKHGAKVQRNSTEYNFIIEGEIRGNVDKTNDIFLQAGDFIVIKPGFLVNLQKQVIKNTKGITIKIPGIEKDEIKEDVFNKNNK